MATGIVAGAATTIGIDVKGEPALIKKDEER